MQAKQIQNNLTTGFAVVPIAIIITIVMRLYAGVNLMLPVNAVILLVHIGIALLLLQLNHTFTLIHSRTMLPAVIYLLLTGTETDFFSDPVICGVTLIFLLCLFCVFYSYQRSDSQVLLFNISILLSIATIFWKPAILGLPFFWLVLLNFKAFNRKSFLASILGIFVVGLFIFTWAAYKGDLSIFMAVLPSIKDFTEPRLVLPDTVEIIYLAYTGLLIILSFIFLMNTIYSEKIRSRAFMYFLYTTISIAAIAIVLSGRNRPVLISFTQVPAALVISHFFTLSKNKYAVYLLLFSILFYLLFFLGKLHTDLFSWINLN